MEEIDKVKDELYANWIVDASTRTAKDKDFYKEELAQKMKQQEAEVEKLVEDLAKEELLDDSTEKYTALAELEKIQKKFQQKKS
jgi:hypothetical protein